MNTLEDYNYHLPDSLIAQSGAEPRDSSRLMVIDRKSGEIEHRIFRDITAYLNAGDVLVLNQSRVIPARIFALNPQGTHIEVLMVKEIPSTSGRGRSEAEGTRIVGGEGLEWEAMLKPAKRAKGTLRFSESLTAEVVGMQEDGTRVLHFSDNLWNHLEALGQTPLPPYIQASVDPSRYQTVYAKTPGSVAAPTAGLHFTPELMEQIRAMGIEIHYVTLHVGPGTFKPVADSIEKHHMHSETFEVTEATAEAINRARAEGRRIVAVGTTVVRTLESSYDPTLNSVLAKSGETQIFIYPPYEYKLVDALITNFHLPKSTLLMLVSALMGHNLMLRAYQTAVAEKYRFYSLGDAMFIR